MTAEEVRARARGGDEDAFAALVDPFRRELHVHCYRMLGSVQDAEDMLQETLVSAWRSLRTFEERASLRTWLYRIATNRCLNALRSAGRRPRTEAAMPPFELPEPTGRGEVVWLEPYPDRLLEGIAEASPGPDARYEAKEAISLAFIAAVQVLPPRQRAVLILRDVLGFRAAQVAAMIGASEEAVTSALKRARAALARRNADRSSPATSSGAQAERELVERFTRAFEAGDLKGLVALLTENVRLSMPPLPLEYEGRELAERFHAAVTFRGGREHRLVPARANGQPAFGMYVRDPHAPVYRANGVMVLTLSGDRISAMTRFDNGVLPSFELPRILPPRA